jgi:hypothetical protein
MSQNEVRINLKPFDHFFSKMGSLAPTSASIDAHNQNRLTVGID